MLDNYLLIRDFEVNDLNQLHKSRMIEKFIKDRIETKDTSQGYNTEYYDVAYTSIISKKFLDIVHEEFNVSEKLNPIQTWIYVQNNKHSNNVWHNHVNTSSINAVYYIDPPAEFGGLEMSLDGRKFTIEPEVNKLYLFPYWMDHRPLPQESNNWRISVNIEYLCFQRPIYKKTDTLW